MEATKKPSDLFVDKMVDTSRFKIVFLSDYHMAKDKAEKLKLWYLKQETKDINLVIVGGDFDNVSGQSLSKTAENAESEARISAFLTFLEFFCCPIYYIPGNHEPATMYIVDPENPRSLTQFSHNVHLRIESLAAGLSIFGIGGCCPALETNLVTGEKKEIWEGYPYEKTTDYAEDLSKLQTFVDECPDQLIFLTHCGPQLISTNLSVSQDRLVNGGSELVSNFWLKNRERFLMTLHGHVHAGQGMHRDLSSAVINPGSLGQGNFAILDIVRNTTENVWGIRSVQFFDLNSYE